MRRLLGLILAVLAATMLFGLSAGQALANPQCAQIDGVAHPPAFINQDTTLDGNLPCGISISSRENQSITLNLNGFTADGAIQGGSRMAPSFTHLEVENGTVLGGVDLSWGHIFIHDLAIHGGDIGIDRGFSVEIVRNTITNSPSDGIELGRSAGLVQSNTVTGSAGNGIRAAESNLTIDTNQADNNALDGILGNILGGQVTNSHTWFNGGHGIQILQDPGFPDFTVTGSGNWAKHNTTSPQCIGVPCGTTGKPKT
jgi:Right handed beta helix region